MTFKDCSRITQERIQKIHHSSGVFTLDVKRTDENLGLIKVLCDNNVFLDICYLVTYSRTSDGHTCVSSSITLMRKNDSRWYLEKLERPIVYVGNDGMSWYNAQNNRIPFEQMLNEVLPIANENLKEIVKETFRNKQIDITDCYFNTFENRYEVDMDLRSFLDGSDTKTEKHSSYYYKYVSLDTFLSMLQNGTFRMNSVVSMNDTSETFALGEAIEDNLDEPNRYRSLISSKNMLITSFCRDYDSALMWRLYGDNGKGACLCFSASADNVKPIVYVKKEGHNTKLSQLTDIVKQLSQQGIKVHIRQIEDLKYFVKSSQFDYEKESRLLRREEDSNLKIVKYGDLSSYCCDYNIDNDGTINPLGLTLNEVILGKNLPNKDVNYPLIVDILNQRYGVKYINWSQVDALR